MAQDPLDFPALLERIRAGSPEAVSEFLDRFGVHILRMVRRSMHRRLRSQFDSLDFVQDVWASFFTRLFREKTFDRPEELVRFLMAVAHNKVVEENRHQAANDPPHAGPEVTLGDVAGDLVGPDPTPSKVAAAREEWDLLLERQPPVYRRLLALRALGYTYREIARELGLNEKTVRRVIDRLALEPTT